MAKRPTKKRAVDPGDERSHRDADPGAFSLSFSGPGLGPAPSPPDLPVATAPEMVALGASWLDIHSPYGPRWIEVVDPETVDIQDPAHDPLRLAFGGGPWALTAALRLLGECYEVERKDKYTGQSFKTWVARFPDRCYDFGFFVRPGSKVSEIGMKFRGWPINYFEQELNRAWHWAILARREGLS